MIITVKRKLYSYEDDELEAYEELDPKKISKLTDNQKKMLLEDERKKAKRNTSRIVSNYGKKGEKEGREQGKKRGTKVGAIAGAIGGAIGGGVLPIPNSKISIGKRLVHGAIGAGVGAGLGALLGRASGAESGAVKGRASGEAKGRKVAKEQGHDEIERTTRNARALDDYARTHKGKGKDDWEIGFRNQLKVEKKEREEAAERKRQAELERRRVEAEEAKARADQDRAKADRERARTDRDRYYDEHFGWGQYGRGRSSGSTFTQNNYYR